jgi:hypothetical protein
MEAKKAVRLLCAGLIVLGFGVSAAAVSANDRVIVAPWMTIGEDPYLYYGPYSSHRMLRPSSRRVSAGPRVPFPGVANRPEPPFVNGCPPGFAPDRRPIGPPGFVPPPFTSCPPSP